MNEEQEDLGYVMADDVHAAERARWAADDLAYDGSAWPMRRDLTPRERDVLTRILDGWWHTIITIDAERRGEPPRFLHPEPIDVAAAETHDVGGLGGLRLPYNPFVDDPRVSWMPAQPPHDPHPKAGLMTLREATPGRRRRSEAYGWTWNLVDPTPRSDAILAAHEPTQKENQ